MTNDNELPHSNRGELSALRQNSPTTETSTNQLVPTIFHEPWWLQTACTGTYDEIAISSGGVVVGRLPFQIANYGGLRFLNMPALTYVLGPAFAGGGRNVPNILKQITLTSDLIAKLPKAAQVSFRLHGGITNTLAFEAAGFSCSAEFTVEIPAESINQLWQRMRDKTRNVIRRAEEQLTITDQLGPAEFIDFYQENLRLNGLVNFYDRSICTKIISESLHRCVGRLVATVDSSSNPQSAIFTVWDDRTEYYLMSTRAPGSLNGATSLAIWTAIQHASRSGRTFDTAGIHVVKSRLPNMVLLTGFGGAIKPRYRVTRTTPAIQFVQTVRKFARFPRSSKRSNDGNLF